MVLEKFIYYKNGRQTKIYVRVVSVFSLGLMFKRKSSPLLFILNKEKGFSITSIFCKPFKALWLDDKKNVIKEENIYNWKIKIDGRGKYLLECPL